MKMEVLSVQNQFQGQFGVIGSTKVKDWTSPLTPPLPSHHRQQHHHHHHHSYHENNRHHHSNTHYSNINSNTAAIKNNIQGGIDIVDGGSSSTVDGGHYHGPHATHQQNQHQQQQYYHHYHHHQAMPAVAAAAGVGAATAVVPPQTSSSLPRSSSLASGDSDTATVTNADNVAAASGHYNISRYNSNLICCGGIIASGGGGGSGDIDIDAAAVNELSMRLQSELRAAKSRHLACTEVSLPWDLTPRIAAEIIKVSEKEPCGIRGCTIYIEFEDEPSNTRRIASLKIDPNTVSTFELYLTLKHDKSGWTSLLPQFIKNLTRSNTILISPDFSLTKNKLYHSSSE